MHYTEARFRIRSGDLLAWSHRKSMFASWYDFKVGMVRLATRSEYSHVGLACALEGRVFVLEAVKPAVRMMPLSLCGDFYWIGLDAPWAPETREIAFSKIGYHYSELRAMEAFFTDLPAGDVSECAAYVRCILRADGIDLGNRVTPDAIVRSAQLRDSAETIYVTNP